MDVLYSLQGNSWGGPFSDEERAGAIAALESGKVVFLPRLAFELHAEERALLSPSILGGRAKNISLDPSGQLKHSATEGEQRALLLAVMQRFAQDAVNLVGRLFPAYRDVLERARTSFRPVEIEGRSYSPIHDDTRLHIDAFPATPMRGRRILRLFANVNPHGKPRVWNVGEPFADMARKILPRVREPIPAKSWLLAAVGATNGVRSPYDHVMLGLHDGAKLDSDYQRSCPKTTVAFEPGTTWLCFTDQVMHAALSGQHVLEQTFHLDPAAMAEPARTPVRVLEAMTRRQLV